MKSQLKLVALLFLTLFTIAEPQSVRAELSQKDPFVFAVIGDSITRGVWADTAIGHPNPRFYSDLFGAQLVLKAFQVAGPYLHRKGDQRETVTNSLRFISRDKLSAFIGNQDYSLPVLLKNQLGRKVVVLNSAILAGTYRSGSGQLDTLDANVKKVKKQPDLILVHISAVDFVREFSTEEFSQSARAFFNRLATTYPHSAIVVTQLVDVVALVTRENVPTFRLPNSDKMATCGDMYQTMKFGTLFGLRPGAPDDVIAAGYDRLNTMRSVLRDETEKIANHDGPYQNFAGKIYLVEDAVAPPDGNFNRILAADCVHPNVEGHRMFGGIIWEHILDEGLLSPAE